MDNLEQKEKTGGTGLHLKIGIVLLALFLVTAAVWFLLFRINRFTLSVQLAGEQQMYLEHGTAYVDPGAQLILSGSLFWQDGVPVRDVAVLIQGDVDKDKVGFYHLNYSGSYWRMEASAQRTVVIMDAVAPVITLREEEPWQTGFSATDDYDGDLTDQVTVERNGGTVSYAVADSSGNPAYMERQVLVDVKPPVITLDSGEELRIPIGTLYEEPGYTAIDDVTGNLTEAVTVEGSVDWLNAGVYPITYRVADEEGNLAEVVRRVEVYAEPRPEVQMPKEKTIYLTFDDGPGPFTGQLLNTLDRFDVKATFFVTNSGYDYWMKQIVKRGHSIGIHTVSHDYASIYASPEAYFQDIRTMQDIIFESTGVKTTLLRFPGGSSNTVSREACDGIMTVLTEAIQDAGFQYFDWNVDSMDAGGARNAEEVIANVKEGVRKQRVSIVLQHDIHDFSVDAVVKIIRWGKQNGYTFRALETSSPGFHHGVMN